MIIRIEQIGDTTLYLGDCRELLPALTDIDAVVSDVPYGIGFQRGPGGKGLSRVRNLDPIVGDNEPFDPSPLLAWPCVLFGANHYYSRLPDGGTFHCWDKSCGVGPKDSYSDAEFIWTSWRCASQLKRYLWKGILQDGEKDQPKYHVSQKPIAVMEWCLDFVPNARTILDPYMGSGSTGVACVKRGRCFVGIEIEEKHFSNACRRIEQAQRQSDLFVPVGNADLDKAYQRSLWGGC